MVIVDAGDINGVDLDKHVPLDCFFDPFHLFFEQEFCTFDTFVFLSLIRDVRVDFAPI
jgi:hypothetical protein